MEKQLPGNVEEIRTILKKDPLPFPTSPRNSSPEPEKRCPDCGAPLRSVFMDHPSYLKVTGKEPHWKELPCEACERERFLREMEDRTRDAAQRRLNTLLANSMLRERFRDKTFDDFHPYGRDREKQLRVLAIAREFAGAFHHHRQAGTWLLFMGNVGTGKSHLCAAVINEVIRAGFTALFTKTPRLLREVKDTFHRDAELTQSEIIARLGGIDLLVIDEVGIQFGTDTERMILYEILDLRYEAMLPVILTTNISDLKSLEKLLGERIIDRLFEGESKVVVFDWEIYRRFQRADMAGFGERRASTPPRADAGVPPSGGEQR